MGSFYRLDGETGGREWTFSDTEGTFDQSSPVVVGKRVYDGGGAGWLYSIDVDAGRQTWKTQVGGWIFAGAADAERIYLGVKFKNPGVYAYEHDSNGLTDAESSRGVLGWVLALGLIVLAGAGLFLMVR